MRTASDERCRRSNIMWTVKGRLEAEARIEGMLAQDDMKRAMRLINEEAANFFAYFAGSHARDAFTFAILSLEVLEQINELRAADEADYRARVSQSQARP